LNEWRQAAPWASGASGVPPRWCGTVKRHRRKSRKEGKATIQQKLDDNNDYFRKARNHDEVRAIYLHRERD
jgi:hypothetical protein